MVGFKNFKNKCNKMYYACTYNTARNSIITSIFSDYVNDTHWKGNINAYLA